MVEQAWSHLTMATRISASSLALDSAPLSRGSAGSQPPMAGLFLPENRGARASRGRHGSLSGHRPLHHTYGSIFEHRKWFSSRSDETGNTASLPSYKARLSLPPSRPHGPGCTIPFSTCHWSWSGEDFLPPSPLFHFRFPSTDTTLPVCMSHQPQRCRGTSEGQD